jgi:polysaccharide pyruvyl transferase WcaK-like protein
LRTNPPEADAYIVGSDQVWGFWGMPLKVAMYETICACFLDFGKWETKCIAYVAGFGTRKINSNDIKIMAPLLNKFSYVSVREKASFDFCNRCGIHSAEWVPDPTLLLKAEQYRTLYKNIQTDESQESYCWVYMFRDNLDFLKTVYE